MTSGAPSPLVLTQADGVAWEAGGVRVTAAPTDHRPVAPTVGYRVEVGGRVVAIAGDTVVRTTAPSAAS